MTRESPSSPMRLCNGPQVSTVGWTRGSLGRGARSPAGRVITNSAIYALGYILPQAVSVLLLPILTRYLSTADYGILGYAWTVSGFFSALGTFSIQPFVVRYYYQARSAGDVRKFLGTTFLFLVLYNAVLLATALVALPWLFAELRVQVPFVPYVQIALVSAVMQILGVVPLSYFRATEQALAYVMLGLLASLLSGGLSLYLVVWARKGLLGRFYGQLMADAIMLSIYLAIMSRIGKPAWRPRYVRQALRFCGPLLPAQLLSIFGGMSDRFVLERWMPLSKLGLYSVAAGFAAMAPLLSSGLYSALQPQIFSMANDARLDSRMLMIKRYVVCLLMALMCLMIALSRDVIGVVAAPAFHDSYKVACLLVAGVLIQCFITNVPSQYLTALGKTQYEAPSRLGGGIVGFVVMLVLVPRLGMYGAGLGPLVTGLTTLLLFRLFLRPASDLDWGFGRDLAHLGCAALVGWALLQIQVPVLLISVGLKLVFCMAVALVYLQVSGHLRNLAPALGVP